MAADKCKENEGSLSGEDLEIFRTEYVDKEIERIYPNLSPHLPRKQKLHLNVFNGEDLEIAIDKATQWQKEQMIKGAVDGYLARDKETNCLWFFTKNLIEIIKIINGGEWLILGWVPICVLNRNGKMNP